MTFTQATAATLPHDLEVTFIPRSERQAPRWLPRHLPWRSWVRHPLAANESVRFAAKHKVLAHNC